MDKMNPKAEDDNDGSASSDHETDTNADTNLSDAPDTNYTDANSEVHQAFKGDDRGVFCWRIVVKLIMIFIATLVTTMTYKELSKSERNDFEASFNLYSQTIIAYVIYELQVFAESVEALSDTLTAHGLHDESTLAEMTWPYVTVPLDLFNAHAEHVISFSRNNFVWFTPIVDDVNAWNHYSKIVSNDSEVPVTQYLFAFEASKKQPVNGTGPFIPIHQAYHKSTMPHSINASIVNYDTSSEPGLATTANQVSFLQHSILTGVLPLTFIRDSYPETFDDSEPLSVFVEPIFSTFEETSKIVGYVQSLFEWKFFFSKLSSDGLDIVCVLENTCGDLFTFTINHNSSYYNRSEDVHSKKFNDVSITTVIGIDSSDGSNIEEAKAAGACIYTLTVYPTIDFRQKFDANAVLYTLIVGILMLSMVGAFFIFDSYVKRRNNKVILAAVRSTAIVTSMFPSNVRDRLYKEVDDKEMHRKLKGNLKTYLRESTGSISGKPDSKTTPLADLFAETTVLFADIAGFTAWSSVREPCQVFILLETLYAAFDVIAKQRRIFKVETIGDCYVAVSGLPEPRADHAVVMSKFAKDIMNTMRTLTRDLETTLGPDTGDLALRIGLHSGPVTAGVLRGERARFQLFGDTMNTAARMEQTGTKNRIQVSQATAEYLAAGGKSHWLRLREDKIVAKGKGELITHWLEVKSTTSGSKSSCSSGSGDDTSRNSATETENTDQLPILRRTRKSKKLTLDKLDRLIDWNTDTLSRLLQQILDNRQTAISPTKEIHQMDEDDVSIEGAFHANPFYEVKEIIELPQEKRTKMNAETMVDLTTNLSRQLREYVSDIANKYNNNYFHNFEHASHVAMSVSKLLSRIVIPSDVFDDSLDQADKALVSSMHDHTYGITSDPLTQFACVFSALIHDVDHAGVPNTQLVNENNQLASRYDGKSVAEQNSIDLAWELLMKEEYNELRNAICRTKSELMRFRQLVVNAVMATDIMDKDLKQIRNMRWSKAFSDESLEADETNLSPQEMLDQVNRKATIVIEHIIQASDVSHTMQHWHIYRKWNELFYFECYDAYVNGRSNIDPTDTWYQGELGFYDYYIIPLANKLKECGVFGVSSTEYLQYALSNRSEWETRGKEIVTEMKERVMAMKQRETVG